MYWWFALISYVFHRNLMFAIPRHHSEKSIQLQVWLRSRGSGVRGSLSSAKENVIYISRCKKICGRYVLLDDTNVVKLLRWDLMETGWLRFWSSLFKPMEMGLTQGYPASPGGCTCVLRFLEWENAHVFLNQRLIQKIAMRWMDAVFLGIRFTVSAVGRFDQHVLAW